jgi:hypothetical protein
MRSCGSLRSLAQRCNVATYLGTLLADLPSVEESSAQKASAGTEIAENSRHAPHEGC